MAVDYWRRPRRRTRGFTLLEVLVTISVIIVLVGLTLTVVSSMVRQSEVRQTENVLRLLDAAVQEWELVADRSLSWGEDDDPPGAKYDVQGKLGYGPPLTEEVLVISEILQKIGRTPQVERILTPIDAEWIHRYEADDYPEWITSPSEKKQMDDRFAGAITVLDAWGTPIYATHPGRMYTRKDEQHPYVKRDDDGTIRTYNEAKYGSAVNRRIIFVSAGPDGDFGHMGESEGPLYEATLDNLFSSPIDR